MKNNITKPRTKSRPKVQHAFRNIREPIMYDARQNTVLSMQVAASSTSATASTALCPLGLVSAGLSVSSSNVVVGAPPFPAVHNAPLKWLLNTASNFGKYRITRAKLVFVGNQGSTMTGTLVISAFKDVFDAALVTQNAYAIGPNAKTFDLATSSIKELSVIVPVDSSWKKVSQILCVNLGAPFTASAQNYPIQVNSANDLCFGAFSANAFGCPNLSQAYSVGTFFLDYDVEFGDPESSIANSWGLDKAKVSLREDSNIMPGGGDVSSRLSITWLLSGKRIGPPLLESV